MKESVRLRVVLVVQKIGHLLRQGQGRPRRSADIIPFNGKRSPSAKARESLAVVPVSSAVNNGRRKCP